MPVPAHITVLGGGITGLSSAFHLSRRFPKCVVTLIEKQPRLGGWIRSEHVEIQTKNGTETVILEGGPQTLRPNAKAVLELINLLSLEEGLVVTWKTSPAAKSRFIQMPGTYGLVQIPSSVFPVFTSPLRKLILSGVLGEAFRRANRPENIKDESLDAFMTRRFGESFARTFGSALVHGIYAADSRKLSVRAAFPSLWTAEERGWGSVVRGMLMPSLPNFRRASDYGLGEASQILKNASVYSFMDGMQTLTDELEYYLSNQSNVGILRNTSVTLLQQKEDKSFEITLSSGTSVNPTHVVSTLPLPVLKTLLGPGQTILPHLTANPSSSVSVVDIIFPGPPSEIHPEGFGYLIPRPESDYSHSSPAILGTIFDSCSLQNRSTQLTRLTMMLGGPYPSRATENITLPFILRNLEEHLQRRLPQPVFWKVRQNENCIPVPTPGHLERMEEMRKVLKDQWDGRLKVIGAGVGGVSVGDCVEAGKRVGQSWNNT